MREICAREYGGETVAGEGGAGHGWTGSYNATHYDPRGTW